MIVVAVTIGLMYIRPTLAEIKVLQDDAMMFEDEKGKVAEVNAELARKVATKDSVSDSNSDALKRFMPNEVDEIRVLKDIDAILRSVNVAPLTLTYGGVADSAATDSAGSSLYATHTFDVGVAVTYEKLKELLLALEVNDYVLQVNNLSIAPSEDEELSVTFSLAAFSLPSRDTAPVTQAEN
jgi:hypothetical protein